MCFCSLLFSVCRFSLPSAPGLCSATCSFISEPRSCTRRDTPWPPATTLSSRRWKTLSHTFLANYHWMFCPSGFHLNQGCWFFFYLLSPTFSVNVGLLTPGRQADFFFVLLPRFCFHAACCTDPIRHIRVHLTPMRW